MKMSAKQRLWLDAYLNHWNKTQAAKDAGYKCKSNVNFCSVGRANFKKLKPIIDKWLVKNELTDDAIKARIAAGMNAKETKFFAYQGEVITEIEVDALETQRRYVDMAARVKGIYAPTEINIAELDATIEQLLARLADISKDRA